MSGNLSLAAFPELSYVDCYQNKLYWRAEKFANLLRRSFASFICHKRIFAYRMKPIEKLYLLSNEF